MMLKKLFTTSYKDFRRSKSICLLIIVLALTLLVVPCNGLFDSDACPVKDSDFDTYYELGINSDHSYVQLCSVTDNGNLVERFTVAADKENNLTPPTDLKNIMDLMTLVSIIFILAILAYARKDEDSDETFMAEDVALPHFVMMIVGGILFVASYFIFGIHDRTVLILSAIALLGGLPLYLIMGISSLSDFKTAKYYTVFTLIRLIMACYCLSYFVDLGYDSASYDTYKWTRWITEFIIIVYGLTELFTTWYMLSRARDVNHSDNSKKMDFSTDIAHIIRDIDKIMGKGA